MSFLEDRAYYQDARVRAREQRTGIERLDERRMVALLRFHDSEEDGEVEGEIHCRFEVCPTCGGRGSHVNPSIDAQGLSAEDFAEDPEFAESYHSGLYHVPCYGCAGVRVVPVPEPRTPAEHLLFEKYQRWARAEADYAAQVAHERAMGY